MERKPSKHVRRMSESQSPEMASRVIKRGVSPIAGQPARRPDGVVIYRDGW